MGRPRLHGVHIDVRVSRDTADHVRRLAAESGTTQAKVVRKLLRGGTVVSLDGRRQFQEIIDLAAQQRKLGGLIKHGLTTEGDKYELRQALRSLEETNAALTTLAEALVDQL